MAENAQNPAFDVHASHMMSFPGKGAESVGVEPSSPPETTTIPPVCTFSLSDANFQKLKGFSESSADYYSLSLPSRFSFYPFKQLSCKIVNARAQGKFTRAAKENSMRTTVEAVSYLLGDGVSAFNLTLKDFYYVLYWLRLASYTRMDMTHVAQCSNPDHIDRVIDSQRKKEDQKYPPEKWLTQQSLRSVHIINNTTLSEKQFNKSDFDHLEFPTLKSMGIELKPCYMDDVVDYTEYLDFDKPEAEELDDIANLACYVASVKGKFLPYAARVDLVGDLTDDALTELESFEAAMNSYGVTESINVKCPGCGAEIKTELSISAHTFLR